MTPRQLQIVARLQQALAAQLQQALAAQGDAMNLLLQELAEARLQQAEALEQQAEPEKPAKKGKTDG